MVMVKALNLRLKDHRFDPRPLCFQVQATLNKLFTHTCLCRQAVQFGIPVKGR